MWSGVGSRAQQAATPATTGLRSPYHWIIGVTALDDLLAHDTSGIVKQTFDTSLTYVVITAGRPLPAGWVAIPAQTFTSEATLATTLAKHKVLPGVKAIIYDNESWSFTPAAERADPATYMRRAASAAHAHGLRFIATPALDLASVHRQRGETLAQAYLRLRIPAAAARYADVFEIQAQGLQRNVELYASFLAEVSTQARAVNPRVTILAGLSSNPSGQKTTAAQLVAAIHAAPTVISGFWMNDPAHGTYCPRCSGPYPNVIIAALQQL